MNVKPIRWLYEELPGLVKEGVLDEDAAARLRGHYGPVPESMAGRNLLFIVFGALGAVLIGGGISLLLAHNWENLGRPTRAALTFALLLVAQAVAGWTIWKRGGSRAWTEGAGLFLSMAVVSAIALISQTYNMPGDLEGLLFTWMILILPLAYLLESRGVTALVWIGSTWWLTEGPWWEAELLRPGLWLLLVGSTVPLLVRWWRKHRGAWETAMLGWVIGGSVLVAGLRVLADLECNLWVPFFSGALGTFYVGGLLLADRMEEAPRAWRRPFHSIGAVGLAIVMFSLSFQDAWNGDFSFRTSHPETLITMMVLALLLCALATVGSIRLFREGRTHQAVVALLPAAAVAAWMLDMVLVDTPLSSVLINLAALGAGLIVCVHGARQGKLGTANGGLLLVLAILAARFFDADLTFVTRGIGFIVLGAGLLTVNVLVLRRRKEGAS